MKKVFLFLAAALLSLSMQAKVGLIIPDSRSDAETAAATWFDAVNHADREEITLTDDMDLSGYSTIWIMVDRNTDVSGFNSLFNDARKGKLTTFVQNGGNLLLCKQATMLAYTMGRIDYAPEFATFNNTGDWGGVGRSIYTRLGSGSFLSDQSSHPLYDSDNKDAEPLCQYDRGSNARIFLMHTATNSNYRYCGWLEVYNKNLAKGGGNDTPEIRDAFQNDWQATILALRGGIGDYCYTDIVFFKKGENKTSEGRLDFSAWKGNILAIGSAAYLWGSENTTPELTNVEKLTENALTYLESLYVPEKVANPAAETAFLLLANTVEELPSVPEKNAANEFAQTYFTTDVATSEGRYISLSDLSNIPSTVKTIIIHADRESLANWSNVNGVNVTNLLQTWVKTKGGNLVLLRQATMLASEMHRIDYAPHCQALSNSATPEQGEEDDEAVKNHHDKIRVKMGIQNIKDCGPYSPCYVDRSGDGLFDNITIEEAGNDKLITLNNGGLAKNRCYWQSMRYDGTNDATYSRAQFDAFETRYNCQVLAVEGYVEDFCLASIIRFKKGMVPADGGANWKGAILAIGAGGFQYTEGNTANFDVLNRLIRNAVNSIQPTPCDNCFLITL